MKLLLTVRPNGSPFQQVFDEVSRRLPEFRVRPLQNLSLLIVDGPDSLTVSKVRERLVGYSRIGQVVEDFGVRGTPTKTERCER